MPRLSASVHDEADFASTDEVIVYKDEGDADDVKSGLVESLTEEKLGLLTETEQVPYSARAAHRGCQSHVTNSRVPGRHLNGPGP